MNTRDVLAGAGAGAALAYMLDVDRGPARRSWLRDKVVRGANVTKDGVGTAARDINNRAKGIVGEARGLLTRDHTTPDGKLEARVRSVLGRVCSHPRAIDVTARDGDVTLRGPILASEEVEVLSAVASVRGVRAVSSALEAHSMAEGHPALQGQGSQGIYGPDLRQRHWSPTTKVLVTGGLVAAGVGLALYSRRHERHDAWSEPTTAVDVWSIDRSGN